MSAHGHKEDTVGHHKHLAPERLRWAVVTVSDSRTEADDDSGRLLVERLEGMGHDVLEHLVVPDDMEEIRGTVEMLSRDPEVDGIITNGGTGASARDVTIEALDALVGKVLPGFGELFRMLSYESIGTAAYLGRARAATLPAPDAVKILYQLPGSPDACELAITELILPEAGHFFSQANRGTDLSERWSDDEEEP